MFWDSFGGWLYQSAGKLREWLGSVTKNELEVREGRRDQLVGRIQQQFNVSIEDADQMADFFFRPSSNQN